MFCPPAVEFSPLFVSEGQSLISLALGQALPQGHGQFGAIRCGQVQKLRQWAGHGRIVARAAAREQERLLLRGGRTLDSRDLRSRMSMIAAGLAAEGQTRVAPLETVERGYSQLVDRLNALGARVARVE